MTPRAAEEERAMLLGGWASFLTLTSYESPLGHHHLNKNNAERDITQLRLVVEKNIITQLSLDFLIFCRTIIERS
jgi:hypothetical protein